MFTQRMYKQGYFTVANCINNSLLKVYENKLKMLKMPSKNATQKFGNVR